jgi:hypothetical protein
MRILLLLFILFLVKSKLLYAFAMIRHGALYAKKDYYKTNIPEILR